LIAVSGKKNFHHRDTESAEEEKADALKRRDRKSVV
jgi:hypothetical protein